MKLDEAKSILNKNGYELVEGAGAEGFRIAGSRYHKNKIMKELLDAFDAKEISYKLNNKGIDGSDSIYIDEGDVVFVFLCDRDNKLVGTADFGNDKKAFTKIWSDDDTVAGMLDFYLHMNWNNYKDALSSQLKETMDQFWSSKKETGKPVLEEWQSNVIKCASIWCKEVWDEVVKDKYQDYVKTTNYYLAKNNGWR